MFAAGLDRALAAAPVVSNVRSVQRAGTQLVDIDYDLADPDSATLTVTVAVSTNGGATYDFPATRFTGAFGINVSPGTGKRITWNAGQDWPNKFSANVRFRVTASDDTAPSGMALIPAGSFTMGDTFDDGGPIERPTHTVYLSAFYMDKNEVTKTLWDEIYQWATNHGYSFDYWNSGQGKAANHPVQSMTWYDAVKWCNARSEKEGRTPAYYTSAAWTSVYRVGQFGVNNTWVNWNTGYRLPTEGGVGKGGAGRGERKSISVGGHR
jgi:formylglycine-generating enzyme required for sulfatase activity